MNGITAEQVRDEEMHWMTMYEKVDVMLTNLRAKRGAETDEDVKAELKTDIEGLRKKKDELRKLLGLTV